MILDRLNLIARRSIAQAPLDFVRRLQKLAKFTLRKSAYIGKKFGSDRHLHSSNLVAIPILDLVSKETKCVVCSDCREVCPCACIEIKGSDRTKPVDFVIDLKQCIGCGLCIDICPENALIAFNSFRLGADNEARTKFQRLDLLKMRELSD